MGTYTKILYHLIFSTKNRSKVLTKEKREILFRYISGLLKNKSCFLYRINGIEDHIHILFSLHPVISLADIVKDIKVSSSKFIKDSKIFPKFEAWQTGYGAFSVSYSHKNKLIDYINKQEEHHKGISFIEEYKNFLEENGIKYDQNFLQ